MERTIAGEQTSGRAEVLCLLPGVPFPAHTGGALRALGMLRSLDRAFELTALAWGREGEDAQALERLLAGRVHIVRRATRADGAVAELMGQIGRASCRERV